MFKGYRTIFWGIFFSVFHVNLGMIQILPVFVAWLIVAHGINLLYEADPTTSFKKAYDFSLFTAVISIIGPISTWVGSDYAILEYVSIVYSIFELFVIYYLLDGSIRHIKSKEEFNTETDYEGTLRIYMIFFIVNTILACIAITIASLGMLMIVAIVGMIMILWLMQMIHSLKKLQLEEVPNV